MGRRAAGRGGGGAVSAAPPRRGFPRPCTSPNLPAEGAGPSDVTGRGLLGLGCPVRAPLAGSQRLPQPQLRLRRRRVRPRPSPAPSEPQAAQRPPSRPRRVHAAAIPPRAMARPLRDGSRAEPTAAVSGSPAFPVGGAMALPPSGCQLPLALPPRLNSRYLCGRGQEPPRSRSGDTQGSSLWPTTEFGVGQQEPPAEPLQRVVPEANGYLPRSPLSLEQAIGARLRQLGDQFHQEQAQRQQEHRGPQGALWGHLHHLVFHLLGIFYNLPVGGMAGRRLN